MDYVLDHQIGYLLRKAQQRHLAIFAARMPQGLTARQFAAMARLREAGTCSQNALGRLTAMDNATISGVLVRLEERGWIARGAQSGDRRMLEVRLTEEGVRLVDACLPEAAAISEETLGPLEEGERAVILSLLQRLG